MIWDAPGGLKLHRSTAVHSLPPPFNQGCELASAATPSLIASASSLYNAPLAPCPRPMFTDRSGISCNHSKLTPSTACCAHWAEITCAYSQASYTISKNYSPLSTHRNASAPFCLCRPHSPPPAPRRHPVKPTHHLLSSRSGHLEMPQPNAVCHDTIIVSTPKQHA